MAAALGRCGPSVITYGAQWLPRNPVNEHDAGGRVRDDAAGKARGRRRGMGPHGQEWGCGCDGADTDVNRTAHATTSTRNRVNRRIRRTTERSESMIPEWLRPFRPATATAADIQ